MAEVTMYATHSCPYCQQALAMLETEHIGDDRVHVVFVDVDADARTLFQNKGFSGVPAFETADDRWQGFDPNRLRQTLSLG